MWACPLSEGAVSGWSPWGGDGFTRVIGCVLWKKSVILLESLCGGLAFLVLVGFKVRFRLCWGTGGGFCGFGSWGIFSFLLAWATGGWSSGAVTCLVLLVSGLFPGAVAWGWVLVLRGTCGGRVLRGPSCISIVLGLMHVMVVRSSGMYILRSFDGKCIVRPWR